jgi:D-glycerate 3-kinase
MERACKWSGSLSLAPRGVKQSADAVTLASVPKTTIAKRMRKQTVPSSALKALLERERLPDGMLDTISAVHVPLADYIGARIDARAGRLGTPFTIGICGAQGSGKSTLAMILRALLAERGRSIALLSLDDFYLGRAERARLAQQVHPLLATRGVPGTHDVDLAEQTFEALNGTGTVAIPSFDKARDERRPVADWTSVAAPVDVILFEGWCVGARPQEEAALREPVNELERRRDGEGTWRRYVNEQLETRYRPLFERVDDLVLLKAPSFEVVYEWRAEQERKLRERLEREGGDTSRLMDEAMLRDFIAHYERLTRHILTEMPARADIVIDLDAQRRPVGLQALAESS